MLCVQSLLTIDPSLGRLDPMLISDQALMEIVFDDITLQEEAGGNFNRNDNGDWIDVCDWPEVECDDLENVTKFDAEDR